jgi:hypothetical protein
MSNTPACMREAYDELLARIEDLEASLALERTRQLVEPHDHISTATAKDPHGQFAA